MQKSRLLEMDKITFDPEIYPRTAYSWIVAYNYSNSMKAGSKFPPIICAELDKKIVLLDGKHRIEAHRMNKEKFINAVVLTGLDRKQAFAEAVESNIAHGYPLSVFDKARCVQKLEQMHFSLKDISKIIRIPADKLTQFVAKRITSTLKGDGFILKSALKHMAGQEVDTDFDEKQESFYSRTELRMINELIILFENESFIKRDVKLARAVLKLKVLLDDFVSKNRRLMKKAKKEKVEE